MTKEKKILIQQLGSKDNLIAINAVNTLRKKRNEARSRADNIFSSVCAGSLTNLAGENFQGQILREQIFHKQLLFVQKLRMRILKMQYFVAI